MASAIVQPKPEWSVRVWGRKKGVNFGEAERGGKGAASGGGSELRGLLSEPKRKERELSAVEGGEADRVCRQPSEARALLKRRRAGRRRASEFRGAEATRNASPSTGESRERALRRQRACRQSAGFLAVWRQLRELSEEGRSAR